MSDCVPCNVAPPPCQCSASQTCVQTPRNCTSCPQNICINSSDPNSSPNDHPSSSGSSLAGAIGGTIGGLAAGIILILLAWIAYRRNRLPSFFYPSNHKTSSGSSNKKNNLRANNNNNNNNIINNINKQKNQSRSSVFNSKSSHHQSIIYLPTNTIDSIDSPHHQSDDDPFSDKHSGVSIIGTNSKLNSPSNEFNHAIQTVEYSSPQIHLHPSVPLAHLSPQSKPLPQTDLKEHHDNNHQPPTDQSSPNPQLLNSSPVTNRTSFYQNTNTPSLPVLPPPTGSPPDNNVFRPVRPHRAPDLDLRLPNTSQDNNNNNPASSDLDNTRSTDAGSHGMSDLQNVTLEIRNNIGSTDGMPIGSRLSLDPSARDHPNQRPLSGLSDSNTHDSHLSSILDPAMIVTPVTLVRTASGRQAAVQRVALRGQEKARVVRLPPNNNNNNPHGPSPLSKSSDSSQQTPGLPPSNLDGFSSLNTPGLGRNPADQADPAHHSSTDSCEMISGAATGEIGRSSSLLTAADGNKLEDWQRKSQGPTIRRNRSTAAYSTASSSFGGSSVCDSFIEDEEVEFPTVLGRSAATLAQRLLQQREQLMSGENGTPVIGSQHHQLNVKALGRDRAISLSSIITEEAALTSSEPPPPLPTPTQSSATATLHPISRKNSASSSTELPEPYKPFAGQKPRASGRASQSQEQTVSVASSGSQPSRLSTASSIRSGYGSVLEGIPFNIGFNSEGGDLFGNNFTLSLVSPGEAAVGPSGPGGGGAGAGGGGSGGGGGGGGGSSVDGLSSVGRSSFSLNGVDIEDEDDDEQVFDHPDHSSLPPPHSNEHPIIPATPTISSAPLVPSTARSAVDTADTSRVGDADNGT